MPTVERDPYLLEFGARVAKARTDAGLSQSQLTKLMIAHGVHVPATAVAKIETATRPTSVPEAQAIARIASVSVQWLVEGDPPPADAYGIRLVGRAKLDTLIRQLDQTGVELFAASETYGTAARALLEFRDEWLDEWASDEEPLIGLRVEAARRCFNLQTLGPFYLADQYALVLDPERLERHSAECPNHLPTVAMSREEAEEATRALKAALGVAIDAQADVDEARKRQAEFADSLPEPTEAV